MQEREQKVFPQNHCCAKREFAQNCIVAMMQLCNIEQLHLCKVCVKLHLCNGEQDFCKRLVVQDLRIIAKLPLSNGAGQHSCSSLPAKCTKCNGVHSFLDHLKFLEQLKLLVKSEFFYLYRKIHIIIFRRTGTG